MTLNSWVSTFLSFIHPPVHLGSRTQPCFPLFPVHSVLDPVPSLLATSYHRNPSGFEHIFLTPVMHFYLERHLNRVPSLALMKRFVLGVTACPLISAPKRLRRGTMSQRPATGLPIETLSQTTNQTKEGTGRLLSGQRPSPNKPRQKARQGDVNPGSMDPRTMDWNLWIRALK